MSEEEKKDVPRETLGEKKVSQKLANASPLRYLPSVEFVQIMGSHGVGFSKEHCEWLRRNVRFQDFYNKAEALGLTIIPNEESRQRKLLGKENLVYVVDHTTGQDGYLKLLEFASEFAYKDQDARKYVV